MSDAAGLDVSTAEPGSSPQGTEFPPLTAAEERRLACMLNSHFESVWRVGRRMGLTQAQAEENAQEAFAVVARKLPSVHAGRERAYLLGVAARLAVNTLRLASQRVDRATTIGTENVSLDGAPLAEDLLAQKQQRALLDQLLQSLSDEFRQVLTLCEVEEMTLPEVAIALEIPLGTAASRLRRAREEFDRKLAAYGARARRGVCR